MLHHSDSIPHYIPPSGRQLNNGFLKIAETAHRLHGDLVWVGHDDMPLLLLAGARHIRLLVEHEATFLKEFDAMSSASTVGRIIMGPSLTTSKDGEEWRIARKITTPTVNPKSPLLKKGSELSAQWLTAVLQDNGQKSLRSLCLQWALMCVAEGFFGSGISLPQLSRIIDHFRKIYLQLIIDAPTMSYEEMRRHPALVAFREETEAMIGPHIDNTVNGNTTMLERLCQALRVESRDEGRDRVMSLLLGNLAASVDNTGIALLWTLTHLSQHQLWQHIIKQESEQKIRTTALAVVKESLRLTPVTAFFERRLAKEIVIDNTVIPEGVRVLFSPWLIHRNKNYWNDPLKFDPARFLTHARIPSEYFHPFSVGKRNCVGMTLALDQLTTAVTTFCEHYTFTLAPGTRPGALTPLFELNVMPRGDICFILEPNDKVTQNDN